MAEKLVDHDPGLADVPELSLRVTFEALLDAEAADE